MTALDCLDSPVNLTQFSKRVPATSVSPTYKLTLPSEFVSGYLSHLLEKDFKLVHSKEEQAWDVAILPRRNKDKFEYTLQGWRAFAEEQDVRTGDMLDFVLLDAECLQIEITRKPQALQQPAVPRQGRTEFLEKPASTTSSDDEALLREAGVTQPLNGQMSDSKTPGVDHLLVSENSLDVLGLGHDLKREALSPQVPSSVQKGSLYPKSSVDQDKGSQQPLFRHSSDSDTFPLSGLGEDLWLPPLSGEAPQGPAPKRLRTMGQADFEILQDLPPLIKPDLGMTGLEPTAFRSQPSLQAHYRGHSGIAVPHQQLPRDLHPLPHTLPPAHAEGSEATRKAAILMELLRTTQVALEQQTSSGLSLTNGLFRVADRMASSELLRLLEPQAAKELDSLRSNLRTCANGLWNMLWHIRADSQQNHRRLLHMRDPASPL